MLLDQPGHQIRVGIVQAVATTEAGDIGGSEFGVVAAPALADVVIEARDVQKLRLRYLFDTVVGDGEALFAGAIAKPSHVADHHHGVGVDGVDMKKVVLHLAHHATEFRQVTGQHAIAPHSRQL